MSRSLNKTVFGPVGLVLAVCFLVNCQRARLEPQLPVTAVTPPSAPTNTVTRTRAATAAPGVCKASSVKPSNIVKVLFVVDGSGSNFGAAGSVATDPEKKWRTQTLRQFFTRYVEKKNFHFGMTLFKGTSSRSLINVQGEPGFSNERAVVSEGFRSFLSINDGGNTPYKAALKMARNIIAADLQDKNSEQATYAVVMVSDGRATDYKNAHDVIPDASAIKDLAPDRITLNSIYYSSKKLDARAPQYLKSIAQIGEGAFIVANSNESLKLDDVVRFAPVSCH